MMPAGDTGKAFGKQRLHQHALHRLDMPAQRHIYLATLKLLHHIAAIEPGNPDIDTWSILPQSADNGGQQRDIGVVAGG
ncbi:hypothetical protein D3C80_1167230 [compost metagenome]